MAPLNAEFHATLGHSAEMMDKPKAPVTDRLDAIAAEVAVIDARMHVLMGERWWSDRDDERAANAGPPGFD